MRSFLVESLRAAHFGIPKIKINLMCVQLSLKSFCPLPFLMRAPCRTRINLNKSSSRRRTGQSPYCLELWRTLYYDNALQPLPFRLAASRNVYRPPIDSHEMRRILLRCAHKTKINGQKLVAFVVAELFNEWRRSHFVHCTSFEGVEYDDGAI